MILLRLLFVLSLALSSASLHAAPKNQGVLNLMCWAEYVPKSVVDGFTRETGIRVDLQTYDLNEEMLARMFGNEGRYDLIQPSGFMVEALALIDRLEPIDHSRLTNFKNLDPKFVGLPFDPENKYSVPWLAGTIGIIVNTDKIKEPIQTYKDVFSGKYAGRIVTVDDNREILSWAFFTLGLPVDEITPENLAKARPLLAQWIPQIKAFDSGSPKNWLRNGDADIGIIPSGEAANLMRRDPKWRYILPPEGVYEFVDSLCIPKDAPHKANAEKFLDYILRPDVSALISAAFPYTNPNAAARNLLPKEALDNPASYPPGQPKVVTFGNLGAHAKAVEEFVRALRQK